MKRTRFVFKGRCFFSLLFLLLILSSCASVVSVPRHANALAASGRADQALKTVQDHEPVYGETNRLLFLLDQGLMMHYDGRFLLSVESFSAAKNKYDELYTRSLTRIAASWLWNDYAIPYRGEDYERVMINIFQALNYTALGNLEAARVEARDVDSTLSAINLQYDAGQKNVYREDAFARLLMGIFYESTGTFQGVNDARISYQKSYAVYCGDYREYYGVEPPQVLKENLSRVSKLLGQPSGLSGQDSLPPESGVPVEKRLTDKGEIYIIQYHGFVPAKESEMVPVPLPGGYISSIAFPRLGPRKYGPGTRAVRALSASGAVFQAQTELAEDITGIAENNLRNSRARVIAKGVVRSAGRYFLEKELERNIHQHNGRDSAYWFRSVAGIFNLFVEQPDLRSWQTLPGEILIARMSLDPGDYTLFSSENELEKVSIKAGERKFVYLRTFF